MSLGSVALIKAALKVRKNLYIYEVASHSALRKRAFQTFRSTFSKLKEQGLSPRVIYLAMYLTQAGISRILTTDKPAKDVQQVMTSTKSKKFVGDMNWSHDRS